MTVCNEENKYVEDKWLLAINYIEMGRYTKDFSNSTNSLTDFEQEAIILDSRETASGNRIIHIQFVTGDVLKTFITKNMRLL